MKKLLAILAIVLLPLSAFAGMSAITDSEMAAVTGQMGVSIAIVDQQQDIAIAQLTWGDTDTKVGYGIAGHATDYTAGYINIQNIGIIKNTTTLHPVQVAGILYADPLKIDVVSLGAAVSSTQKFAALAYKTAVLISLSDSIQTIDEISIGSISLDNSATGNVLHLAAAPNTTASDVHAYLLYYLGLGAKPANVTSIEKDATDFYTQLNGGWGYSYVNAAAAASSHQLGYINIKGLTIIGYSHLEGYASATSHGITAGNLYAPSRPGSIAIFAHDSNGD
jgi:hypothetical protein